MGRRIVGIDLGTTHTVIAWLDPEQAMTPKVFEVPSLSAPGLLSRQGTLNSVLYAPHPGEFPEVTEWLVGDYAERRGREVPGRAIVSAKSWLSYAAVDRNAPILPWGSEESLVKLSPVAASSKILAQLKTAWDEAFPTHPLHEQSLVLTVPASFDPTARQLTLEAAKNVGLSVRLLEEPQAAFYDYLERCGEGELQTLLERVKAEGRTEALVLVCDVGGGTTDLTLLSITESPNGAPSIERIAVGRHLLLGGDNMDLALAHHLERSFASGSERLSARRFAQLVLVARTAKERLLSPDAPDEVPVTLVSEGSSLVGGTRTATLTKTVVETLIVQGFFPEATLRPLPARARSGLIGFGLPYETEPAITRHVAAFLHRHAGTEAHLDALLLNGGAFLSPRLVDALKSALAPLRETTITTLHQPHPELAVARGAAVYGLSLLGRGLRIGGGSAFGYYVAVDSRGAQSPRAVCVVPRGSREGEAHRAASAPLALTVGKPVRFELYSTDSGPIHAPGELVELVDGFELTCPIAAHFTDEKPREVPVVLEGELSAIGTLELACVTTETDPIERFALAFELRGQEAELRCTPGFGAVAGSSGTKATTATPAVIGTRSANAAHPSTGTDARDTSTSRASGRPPPSKLDEAAASILRVFGKTKAEVSPREVKDLVRTLEQLLGARAQWNLDLSRQLFDLLGSKFQARRRSLDHERIYFMLTGYLLRPGFGHPLDRTRVQHLAALFAQGLAFPDEIRSWQQFFIAYRRIAPGLDETEQIELFTTLLPHLSPSMARGKKKGPFRPLAEPEMLECASWLERLPVDKRVAQGEAIIERTWTKRDPLLWAALGRIGARIPVYGSLHHVVPTRHVEDWLDHLLREKWEDLPTAPNSAVQMARLTGDRARDVNDNLRQTLCLRLERLGTPSEQWRPLRELVEVADKERVERFGEELPVGLRWITP
jgi:molecular chaperone DnaK (HSP70)